MLGDQLVDQKADFFTFHHTGATHIAESAATRSELMLAVNMMHDTNVETVRRHYFNFEYDEDEQMIDGWELPQSEENAAGSPSSIPSSIPSSPI